VFLGAKAPAFFLISVSGSESSGVFLLPVIASEREAIQLVIQEGAQSCRRVLTTTISWIASLPLAMTA
jgi:hypothetical protein